MQCKLGAVIAWWLLSIISCMVSVRLVRMVYSWPLPCTVSLCLLFNDNESVCVVWLCRYVATKMFVSNLNSRLAQRFLALVLLPRVRRDIAQHKRLHFALFQALKKATYKAGAFYKVCGSYLWGCLTPATAVWWGC